jgi:nicotinate-nucleotide pyrophosphorylase (carboxylating)
MYNTTNFDVDLFIINALREDIADGDHTTESCIEEHVEARAKLLVKENGILSGLEIAKRVFELVDKDTVVFSHINDGDEIKEGDIVFEIVGKAKSILKAERLSLNIMQRMSGIATNTKKYVDIVAGTNAKILDTRKTTPGMRYLEIMAVTHGGGKNHGFGLYDMIMIKDNHIDYAGGIKNAIEQTVKYLKGHKLDLKIEVEARSFQEIEEIMSIGQIDRIMIDNFTPEDCKKAVKLIAGKYETEASGGITDETLRAYAETGVDFISIGALTHHIKSLDLSLKAVM